FFLSSMTGSGTGELLDAAVEYLTDQQPEKPDLPHIAIVGQPNAGKSSLVNSLLGEERNIVTDVAGTTRDSINTHYNKFGKEFIIIDTAGMRKKARVHENLEFYSVMRAIKAIEESDVCVLMIDATMGVESQDLAIFRLAQKRNKGIVILMNKWDLVEKETNTARDMEKEVRRRFAPFTDVPVIFVSATEKQRIMKGIDAALEVYANRSTRIPTSKLNNIMLEEIERMPPPAHRGRYVKIKFVTQLPLAYPAFAFFCNNPKHVRESYKNFLENKLREHFNFTGIPITIFFRQK
ncbi:MAG: ribosome biogenesis GTPase Der, partial [Bacteroidota bacterium]